VAVQVIVPWHELGHAAAARYFGARHGPMGVGLMGLGIVAYVDVGDVWRLQRRQRLVVDLGGVYFQSMSVILLSLLAWATNEPALLWIVLAMDFHMLMNLNPLFKLDGYWAVSDATGIPNLHQRVGEVLGRFAATRLLAVGRLLHLRSLVESPKLRAAASATGSLSTFGGGARLALMLFTVLFLLSAAYLLLFVILVLPMLVLSYPLIVVQTAMTIAGLLAGEIDASFAVIWLLQFVFVTALLANLVFAGWMLIRAARNRNRSMMGWGGDFRMQG
jgi:hypothetical protein